MAHFEKDFRQLSRQIDSISNGQARVSYENIFHTSTSNCSDASSNSDSEENSLQFFIEITPNDGPYANGSFIFRIEIPSEGDYPECQPIVSCLTRIYHPNIDTTFNNNHNNVCVSTLNDWDGGPNSTFQDLLQSLMYLFYYPNPDDPLTSNIASDPDEFLTNARISVEGGTIADFDYEPFEMNYGYKRYLLEKENENLKNQKLISRKREIEETQEELDEELINILTREPNFKQLFTPDTLEFLMNGTSAPSLNYTTRHSKEWR